MTYLRGRSHPRPRLMKSQFKSRCTACSCDIEIGEAIVYTPGMGARHETPEQCSAAQQKRNTERAAREASNPTIDLKPVVDFLIAAQARGLKNPKLRVLGLDGKTELKLQLTKAGAAPGSLAVLEGGNYIGAVRPDGRTTGTLATNVELQKRLVRVAKNPTEAGREYAALTGNCSFCGKLLEDAGSVRVGYGPVCAKHWGLPHHPEGTPHVPQQK